MLMDFFDCLSAGVYVFRLVLLGGGGLFLAAGIFSGRIGSLVKGIGLIIVAGLLNGFGHIPH